MAFRAEHLREADTRDGSTDPYYYEELPFDVSFRVAELLPGNVDDQIVCNLHLAEWHRNPQYEAISYAWGNPLDRAKILCDGRTIRVTRSLYTALIHFRRTDQSKIIWADGLCINQESIPERGFQVKQMKTIYERAQKVLAWLGPDNEEKQAHVAIQSIYDISEFLCKELAISVWEHNSEIDSYQEIILKNRDKLPLPNETDFNSERVWRSLAWLYSHQFFSRVWAIQEVNANVRCKVYVGHSTTMWNRVDLVACHLILDTKFSDTYGFSDTNCWYVATFAELIRNPSRWLNMLYLASNYGCLDARDVIYGLRSLMKFDEGESLLDPDYRKSTEEVYRDCAEAALINFKKTDVLLYVTGSERPSWVPRWDVPMLFRNPFRFGKPMPWRPAADTTAEWQIDKATNTLTLSGFIVDVIVLAETYNQLWFADTTMDSTEGQLMLKTSWTKILHTLGKSQKCLPLSQPCLAATAVSLSFGMNYRLAPSERVDVLRQFIAYLALVLVDAKEVLKQYVPADLIKESEVFHGRDFGKPVWDFQYPDASIFVTKEENIGCAISPTQPHDVVFVPYGSTYPMIVRPVQAHNQEKTYALRGFSYIDGVMNGEYVTLEKSNLKIC